MANKAQLILCPIRKCGCEDVSCDGVLPVHAHEDGQEYDDGDTRYRLVCFKGDTPYELPDSYTQEELKQLIAEYEHGRKSDAPNPVAMGHGGDEQKIVEQQTEEEKQQSQRHKRGGESAYAGKTVAGFTVDQDSTRVTVKGRTFKISHNADKNLIDQVISAVQNCQQGFSIHLPPKEYNALSPDGKCFAALFVVREVRKGKGNRKYTGYACLK